MIYLSTSVGVSVMHGYVFHHVVTVKILIVILIAHIIMNVTQNIMMKQSERRFTRLYIIGKLSA